MYEITLLKLGGSILTEKGESGVIHYSTIRSIASIIRNASIPLLLVHGAGSCGHPEAMKYRIMDGVTYENREGILVTHTAVKGLNDKIIHALTEVHVPALGINPLTFCVSEDRELISCETAAIQNLVQLGIVPVIHGDVVMDTRKGATVISGDQLIRYIAPRLGTKVRVGLATDVAGVLSGVDVVPEITRSSVDSLNITGSGNTDVTGGMQGKVMELLKLADFGINSDIFHVSRLTDFLKGLPHGGTTIRSGS